MLAAVDGPADAQSVDGASGGRERNLTTVFMLADLAAAGVELLAAHGIDVRGQLGSPYLMPEDL